VSCHDMCASCTDVTLRRSSFKVAVRCDMSTLHGIVEQTTALFGSSVDRNVLRCFQLICACSTCRSRPLDSLASHYFTTSCRLAMHRLCWLRWYADMTTFWASSVSSCKQQRSCRANRVLLGCSFRIAILNIRPLLAQARAYCDDHCSGSELVQCLTMPLQPRD